MTSSCCTKRWSCAVPYSNLRGAIGTFHAGKFADPSRKVSLHRNFLHRRSYAAVLHTLWWDAIGTSHTEKPANSSSKWEPPCENSYAVCSSNSGYHS